MEKYQTLSLNDIRTTRKISKNFNLIQHKPNKSTLSNKINYINEILKTKNKKPNELKILASNTALEFNVFDNSDRSNTLSFEKYDEKMENSLNKYKPIHLIEDDNNEKSSQQKPIDDYNKKINLKVNFQNKNTISRNDDRLKILRNNNSNPYFRIKINSTNFNYENPNQSLKILNCNNDVYNEIKKDSLLLQKAIYINTLKNYKNHLMKFKLKMPKIKISDRLNKLNEEISTTNLIEEQKKDGELLPSIPNTGELKLFSYFKYPIKNFPESREQFSICEKNKNIILTGGISTKMKEMNIWSLNIKKIQWTKIPILGRKSNCRFGHTTINYQQKIYFYGGRIKYKNTSILVGLEIYSFIDKKFYIPSILDEPPERRDHIAIKINDQMLIHGGIGINNKILSDCYLLNLPNLKWIEPTIDNYNSKPKVYGHTCCLVIPIDILTNKDFSIYKYPDLENPNVNSINKIKEKGLYIFGGKTDIGFSNELWILLFGNQILNWKKIEPKGKPPSPRCFHSMEYFEKGNYLIIHGGRNDDISVTSALNDTFILKLENLEWVYVTLYSNIQNFEVISRYGHKSTIFSDKLVIFGGMNNSNYIGSSLFIVNLDFYYNRDYKNGAERKTESLKKDNKNMKINLELGKLKLSNIFPLNLPPIK